MTHFQTSDITTPINTHLFIYWDRYAPAKQVQEKRGTEAQNVALVWSYECRYIFRQKGSFTVVADVGDDRGKAFQRFVSVDARHADLFGRVRAARSAAQ
mmetsp:Transcript_9170/g.18456  ORF Transcript_9170/g.18456 Transcript_9170/m.18456 type:complete len:99 (+) Transcript_9170:3-299(+)